MLHVCGLIVVLILAWPGPAAGEPPAAKSSAPGVPATIVLTDGQTFTAVLIEVRNGKLRCQREGRELELPLAAVKDITWAPAEVVVEEVPGSAKTASPQVDEIPGRISRWLESIQPPGTAKSSAERTPPAADSPRKSDAELQADLHELLDIVSRWEPFGAGRRPPLSLYAVESILDGGFRLYAGQHRRLLDDGVRPLLLGVAEDAKRRWLVVGPLAAMYRIGRAKELPQLVRDARTPTAQRVVAAAALHRAGEAVPADALCEMLRTMREQDLRQVAVGLLGESKAPAAAEAVVGYLRDTVLCDVAWRAVTRQRSPMAAEPLAELIREDRYASRAISTLGSIQDPRATAALAQLLAEVARLAPESDRLRELLKAFDSTAGKSFSHSPGTLREKVDSALQWWRQQTLDKPATNRSGG